MNDVEYELRSRVDAFVNELSELVRRQALLAVEEVLEKGSGAAPAPARRRGRPPKAAAAVAQAPRGRGRPPKVAGARPAAAKRRPGEKRTPQELAQLVEQLFNHIKANPGQPVEQIGKALAIPTKDLTLPLRKLMNGKRVTSKGQKRATRYFPR